MLRIAFVHQDDARNVRSWSGTLYFTKQALERHLGEVIDLTPAPVNMLPYRIAGRLVRMTTGKIYPYHQDPALARRYGRYFSSLLRKDNYDLIFSPAGSASLAFLETDIPIIYYSDATWRSVRNYYDCFTNTTARTEAGGDELERRSLEKSSIILYPSTWAADSAVNDYGIDPARVHITFLGANLMTPPAADEVLPRRPGRRLRLLLVGVNWDVKGGDTALETLKILLERGYDAELTVVGCTAPPEASHPRMKVIPFLNKSIPAERQQFEDLWRSADFFILPSRFEAAGLVLSEAGAHALPAIAARTGGIPSLIVDGRNGFTVPPGEGPGGYADRITALIKDPEAYAELCRSSRREYEERLNWDVWGKRLANIVAERFPALAERIRERMP